MKLAAIADAGTNTEAGTLRAGLELDSATAVPPVGAACERVAVQVPEAPEVRVVGVQLRDTTDIGGVSAIEAVCETPFREAVMVAFWPLEIVPALTAKVAVVDAEPTVTDAGTDRDGVLLESVTVPPPVWERVTVQLLEVPELKLPGVQLTLTGVGAAGGATVMLVPVVVTVRASAAGVAANAFVTPTAAALTPGAKAMVTVAATPFWIVLVFRPARTQE